jgi:glycerol-3-phosphate dehydrogenase subunit B
MLDLLVIGAGLSGMMAAYTAAKAGLRVRVIAKGLGSMHWTAGGVDLLGYLPGEEDAVMTPLTALGALPPHHPYRILGQEGVTAALALFQEIMEQADLAYMGAPSADSNLSLPSPVGATRPVYLTPAGQRGGDLDNDAPILVMGFRGMRDFYPELIAENLTRLGHPARADFLPLDLIADLRDRNTIQLAHALDEPERARRLGRALKARVQPGERVGLPAILGMDEHPRTMEMLSAESDATVFEIPTLPPSAPGVRLHKALRAALMDAGVRVEAGMEAISFESEEKRVRWVETETAARPLKHRASHFLLATGGILGAGIDSDHTGRAWEVVFDLPLTTPQARSQWFRPEFLDPQGQPVFRGGVAINDEWRPVDGDGRVVYENVWAAGNVLAHTDPILERSLEGVAIATGVAAARSIVQHAGGDA